jgi:hypothetical protein
LLGISSTMGVLGIYGIVAIFRFTKIISSIMNV